ncbi:hypothetical protein [Streptomyces sp. NPDC093544]|uniref:hypothetical protein n=1 Tax=Streptomyces sp. NPDC093544 TaxID=3155200 RepID=UPI003446318B
MGIAGYLLIDREAAAVTVYSDPEDGTYRSGTARPFGAAIELPDSVGFTLVTENLKDFAD